MPGSLLEIENLTAFFKRCKFPSARSEIGAGHYFQQIEKENNDEDGI
jgi:hypothetical protein